MAEAENDDENDNLIELGGHLNMTTKEALGLTIREDPPEVLILFYDHIGEFKIRSSKMSRKDALWLIENARDYTLNGYDE